MAQGELDAQERYIITMAQLKHIRLGLLREPRLDCCTFASIFFWLSSVIRRLFPGVSTCILPMANLPDLARTCPGPTPFLATSYSAASAGYNDCSELQM